MPAGRHQRDFGLVCQNNPLLYALTEQIAHHHIIVGDGDIPVTSGISASFEMFL